jgi:hypothetical protein
MVTSKTTTKRTYEEGPGCDTSGNEKGSKVWTIAILNEFGQECDDEIRFRLCIIVYY